MEHDAYNELTAAYALDALDEADVRSFEEHLAGCEACQADVASLSATAVALSYAAPPVDPPPALRVRVLEAARAERPNAGRDEPADNVLEFRPRRPVWSRPSTLIGVAAAIAACLVIGLGIWNVSLSNQLDDARQALQTVPLQGANGSVVVGSSGKGVLVVSSLAPAPAGKTYEAWVIADGAAARAGTFDGGQTVAVKLERPVPAGAIVAVTVEPAGGSEQPTSKPIITSAPV